jgi:hypothetical protein
VALVIHNLLIDVVGVAAGLGAYAVVHGLRTRRGMRRAGERRDRLEGLLAPYDGLTVVPVRVRDELPANVYQLRRR